MADVELRNLTKTFGADARAVDDLSLAVADGELLSIVGPSGCGKTTTLRLVAGLERPTSGTIAIGGRDVEGVPPRSRDVAMVFQDYALYPHLTVEGNLAFPLRTRRVARDEARRRAREAASMLGLDALLARKPRALSGGEQQRVALGRALVREPVVLLLDEPLSNLDAPQRVALQDEIRRVQRATGTTALHVTHDQAEAMALGDRLAVMAEGRLQQIGTPIEIHDAPANRFVAGFVGAPAMSFLDGALDDRGAFRVGGTSASVALPRADLDGRAGPAVLGVRPTALRPAAGGAIEGRVEFVRDLGDAREVVFAVADATGLVARLERGSAIPGDGSIAFDVDPAGAHVFAPGAFGARLG